MGNKDDWKKLEIWDDDRKRAEIKKYGIDITKEQNTKKVEIFSKTLNKTWDIVYKVVCVLIVLIAIYLLSVYIKSFNELNRRLDIDIIKEMEGRYSVEFVSDGQELDENGNGRYLLSHKENRNIKFSVIKNRQEVEDDYPDKSLKYCFENWVSEYKSIFNVEEYTKENGLLSYSLYANVNKFSEIDKILEGYLDLKKASERYFSNAWNITIKDGKYNERIFSYANVEETKNKAKRNFIIWHKDNEYNLDKISKEDIEKYYKPDYLKIYVNGKVVKSADNTIEMTAGYSIDKDSYSIPLYGIIENSNIETKRDKDDSLQSFIYNEKTYYSKSSKNIPKNTSEEFIIENSIYVEDVERIFETKVKLDYSNKRMDIEIK